MIVERFAPSPTGLLHLGHAYSALVGHRAAIDGGGQFLVRFEDLDTSRVRQEFYDAIETDLRWLGLNWDGPLLRQSNRLDAYAAALNTLTERGLVYTCTCTRRDIAAAANAPQEGAPLNGPDGIVYPGTCRTKAYSTGSGTALRVNLTKAIETLNGGQHLAYTEIGNGTAITHRIDPEDLLRNTGDVVLRRKDGTPAYHLAVVIDDAFQSVTHVTRGADLIAATPLHVLLQALLDLPTPIYRHHALVRDETGKRLAKRDDARSIAAYRNEGRTPEEVLALACRMTASS